MAEELTNKFASCAFRDVRCKRIQYYLQESNYLEPGKFTELEWKDYCPDVFRNIQELHNVNYADYMMLLCSTDILREVSSPSKAGRVILLSPDDQFVIKTVRKSELKVMLDALPNYYFHLVKNPAMIVQILYGLHSVRQLGGLKVYFLVMPHPMPREANVYDIYHLKGSTKGRASYKIRVDEHVINKDSDFDYRFYLDPLIREKLLAQIKSDCEFLEAEGIIEYSLLIGIAMQTPCQVAIDGRNSLSNNAVSSSSPSPPDLVDSSSNSDTLSNCSLQEFEDTQLSFADICQEPDSKFGKGMLARAFQTKMLEMGTAKEPECFNVRLYFTIVDIYQKYNMKKRIEHFYKSIQYDSKSISAVNSQDYSSRFQNFVEQIFLADNSES